MKVVFISDIDEKYGAPKSMMELVCTLRNQYDIQPIVLTPKNGAINEFCNQLKIENYVIGHRAFYLGRGSTWIRKIAKILLKPLLVTQYKMRNNKALKMADKYVDFRRVDVIHTNVNRNDIGALLAQKYCVPHVWHIREFGELDYNRFSLRSNYVRFMNNHATRFIAISNAVKDYWVKKGIQSEKISVVYNGIDMTKFDKGVDIEQETDSTSLKLVFTGSISERKGQRQLIRAVALLPDAIRDAIIVDIYGSGAQEYLFKLKNLVKKLKIEKNVTFCGYCATLPEKLPEYDLGIVCSKSEGFGRVTVEHMAAKLCVIASDSGANPEIIDYGKTGLLYRYGDVQDLCNKIIYAYNNREHIQNIGLNARKAALDRFTTQINSAGVYRVYQQALKAE